MPFSKLELLGKQEIKAPEKSNSFLHGFQLQYNSKNTHRVLPEIQTFAPETTPRLREQMV